MINHITGYYCALNELAAMLADGEISRKDWIVASKMIHSTWYPYPMAT